jgi:hypothetical protein
VYRRTAFLPARRRLSIRFSCPDRPPSEADRCFQLVDFRVVDLSPPQEITAPVEETGEKED